MRVMPLAAESLGVRSMATYVEVGDTAILIDPGATLAPARYGLPPAGAEWEALRRANDRISAYAARANLVFVSHYHEDHYRSDPATYAGRTVVAKEPRRMVGGQQSRRGVERRPQRHAPTALLPAHHPTRLLGHDGPAGVGRRVGAIVILMVVAHEDEVGARGVRRDAIVGAA